jgi:hypothetical protein
LERNRGIDAFLIPVVDIFKDRNHYRSINAKWYLTRNDPNITRGVVKWAYREDGSIDKTKSDTTEAIYKDTGEVVRASAILADAFPTFMKMAQLESGEIPFVYHLGGLNLEQRVKQSDFWRPHWDNRDKHSEEPKTTVEELEKIQTYRHSLPLWHHY